MVPCCHTTPRTFTVSIDIGFRSISGSSGGSRCGMSRRRGREKRQGARAIHCAYCAVFARRESERSASPSLSSATRGLPRAEVELTAVEPIAEGDVEGVVPRPRKLKFEETPPIPDE